MSTALQIAEYLDDMDMFGIESTEVKTAGLYSVRGENTTLVAEHGDESRRWMPARRHWRWPVKMH